MTAIPNLLTLLRVLLVPVLLWLLVADGGEWWAFGVFVFAAATDSVDGWAARRWQGVTRWGQLADPIADKVLIIGALASLALVGRLPWWAVVVIVLREAGVTALRVAALRRWDVVVPASVWGKLKTVTQVVAVALYLSPGVSDAVRLAVLDGAVAMTVASGVEYLVRVRALVGAVAR